MKKKIRKKNSPKFDRYFQSLDILNDSDDLPGDWENEDSTDDSQAHNNNLHDPQEITQFHGQLLKMFKTECPPTVTDTEIPEMPYIYKIMQLDVDKITPQYLTELGQSGSFHLAIRRATEKDIPILVKLYNRAFMMGADPWSPASTEDFTRIFHFGQTIILIATIQDTDVGFIIIDFEGKEKDTGVICGLAVDPNYQQKRIGHYLGLASWEYFRYHNVKELICEVYEHNEASYRLIHGLSFTEIGEKTYYF